MAVLPDLVLEAGHPREWWTELFVGHTRSRLVAGRNPFRLATYLTALATHLLVLDRRARVAP